MCAQFTLFRGRRVFAASTVSHVTTWSPHPPDG